MRMTLKPLSQVLAKLIKGQKMEQFPVVNWAFTTVASHSGVGRSNAVSLPELLCKATRSSFLGEMPGWIPTSL